MASGADPAVGRTAKGCTLKLQSCMDNNSGVTELAAISFTQWLNEWDNFEYSDTPPNRKPAQQVYVFAMSATQLRGLTDVYKRERNIEDAKGLQRHRDKNRTDRIRRYIEFGYPYGDLQPNLRTEDKDSLKKPGWLPTAIVINILTPGESRNGRKLKKEHAAIITDKNGTATIQLPNVDILEEGDVRPFEVIDGQHRLWAFDPEDELDGVYELPVVAYFGLDVAWQAYLFWSINVTPKRINPSHAFDLYPLLRNQLWLEGTGDLAIYREARAQEITEWMYKFGESAWHGRINMLGEKGAGNVSQAAMVRSLAQSFFGSGRGTSRKGLFQAAILDDAPLSWSRAQQVAFIVELWNQLSENLDSKYDWVESFESRKRSAFTDKASMLNQDMGVRAVHAVINDIFVLKAKDWTLDHWTSEPTSELETTKTDVKMALESLWQQPFYVHLKELSGILIRFDWRSLDGPGVRENHSLERDRRAYRGSGGYTMLSKDLMQLIEVSEAGEISVAASQLTSQAS